MNRLDRLEALALRVSRPDSTADEQREAGADLAVDVLSLIPLLRAWTGVSTFDPDGDSERGFAEDDIEGYLNSEAIDRANARGGA